jgi:hypothetical protein
VVAILSHKPAKLIIGSGMTAAACSTIRAVVQGCGLYTPTTQAQRAWLPRLHHGHRHDGAGTTSLPESEFATSQSRKGRSSTMPLPPN